MATNIGKAYVQIIPSAKGIGSTLSNTLRSPSTSAGAMAGSTIGAGIKKYIAAAAIGTTILSVFKKAINEGAKLEQSIGGVETLFKGSASKVEKYASNAFKTAGLSANDYMETVTSFSASLLQSLGGNTSKAADKANMAITDMADNSNKMGTSISSIQYAYQGFAKQNYTMLDNLKLGYGGTKTEMQRLLSDATKLTGTKYNMSNLSDVYSAIHAIQGQMGITGTTAKEAASTFTGSFSSMSSAWTNLLADMTMGNNETIKQDLVNLGSSIITFSKNLIPMILNVVKSGLMALPAAASSAFDAMITAAQSILNIGGSSKITEAIKKWLPKILIAIGQLAVGVLALIGSLVIKLAEFGLYAVGSFIRGILSGAGNLVRSGVTSVAKFVAGIIIGIVKVPAAGAKLVAKLIATIIIKGAKLLGIGAKLVGNLASGIIGSIGKGISAALRLITRIISALKGGIKGVASIGLNIVKGIWSGISSGLGWIKSKISGWVGNVVEFIKKVFKIGSPSKLMQDEVGQWIPKGIALGITSNSDAVTNAMSDIAGIATAPFNVGSVAYNSATGTSSGGIDYSKLVDAMADALTTVTVGVDGRQFGKLVRRAV